jgi:hypothetical protein
VPAALVAARPAFEEICSGQDEQPGLGVGVPGLAGFECGPVGGEDLVSPRMRRVEPVGVRLAQRATALAD